MSIKGSQLIRWVKRKDPEEINKGEELALNLGQVQLYVAEDYTYQMNLSRRGII